MRLLWLFTFLPLIDADIDDEDSPFIDPSEITDRAEYYDVEGTRYAIFLDRVIFTEAQMLCPSRKGKLVELDEEEVMSFLSRALAESAVGYSSLWVGGKLKFGTTNTYEWIESGNIIDTDSAASYPMTEYPFWVDKPVLDVNVSYCVAMDRRGHEQPLLTSLDCMVLRPFICELPTPNKIDKPLIINPPILCAKKKFQLFYGRYTWKQALTFCRERGMRLAVVNRDEEYILIAHRMLRSRPIMENAWIGGIYKDGKWKWAPTNEEISTPDPEEPTSISPADAPPWLHSEVLKEGCLLIDRHICNHAVFVEAKCTRKRDILCEYISNKTTEETFKQIGNTTLWISTYQANWLNAVQGCRTCFTGVGNLVQLNDKVPERISAIYTGMTTTLKTDIRHIWIGGHYGIDNLDFYWVTYDTLISNKSAWSNDSKIGKFNNNLLKDGVGGQIRLCDAPKSQYFDISTLECLNMDREDQKNFFMYGLDCSFKQTFICDTGSGNVSLAKNCIDEVLKP